MSKTHIIDLNIRNNSSGTLVYSNAWFQTGRLADGASWPPTIANSANAQVQCYESDWSPVGCSGWVEYTLNGVPIFFSFSNPVSGKNGIDVGTATSIWDGMGGHYFPVERPIQLSNGTWLNVTINSTSGDTNDATWDVESCDVPTIHPANLELANVEQVWNSLPSTGTRRYFQCDDPPTSLTGIALSHFKGLSVYADKFIFTHTNLGLATPNTNGKYMIADRLRGQRWNQATVDATLDTLHPGWAHPCSSQACGSFMAMGIQQTADSKSSEIQILDIRKTRVNQAATLLGTIQIPGPNGGINGVGMTRESGPDGRYIVAGIDGTTLNVYRSTTSSLITNGVPTVQFERLLPPLTIEDSGPGLGLVTQQDGAIYMFALNATEGRDNNQVNLYKLNLQSTPMTCTRVGTKSMQIPGVSDSVRLLQLYAQVLGGWAGRLLAEYGAPFLNTSFRWGKGLAITSATTIEVYASDRNVLPLSQVPVVGSDKDFSVVTWSSAGSTWQDQLYVLFQANDPGHALYIASSVDGTFTAPAPGYDGIRIGGPPATAVFNDLLYVAFQANDPSHTLYVSSSPDGINFTTPAIGYPGIAVGSAPAMAVFKDQLFVAFQANDQSHTLYVTSSPDGENFAMPATGYPSIAIGSAPAMAVMNSRLYIAFQANDASHTLYITSTADGTSFTPAAAYPGIAIGSAPAMAFYGGKLYIAFQANDPSHTLYVTSSTDGTNFTPAVAYPGISMGGAPAMAVANGRLYIAFQANDSSHTLYVTSSPDGTQFTSPAIGYPRVKIGSAPSMVEFWGLVRSTANGA
jgi:hypothetical protein